MNFSYYKCPNRNLIEVKFDVTDEEVKWAVCTASKKTDHTVDSWQSRSKKKEAKFMDLFMGDLAKNIVVKWLKNNNSTFQIMEYDGLRKDDFKYPDKYDIVINGFKTEIKSSLEKTINFSPENIVLYRRVIINVKSIHSTVSDILIQVIYVSKDSKTSVIESDDVINYTIDELVKLFCSSCKAYISGWLNKDQQNSAIKGEEKKVCNAETGANNRAYADDTLIKKSNTMESLIEFLDENSGEIQVCELCGNTMILRTNKKTGENFWGCSSYPHCKNTKTISNEGE